MKKKKKLLLISEPSYRQIKFFRKQGQKETVNTIFLLLITVSLRTKPFSLMEQDMQGLKEEKHKRNLNLEHSVL